MRLFASKQVGPVRVGVSGNVSSKKAKSNPRLEAALVEQEQAEAGLRRAVAEMEQNTQNIAQKIADLDVDLAGARSARDKMVSDVAALPASLRARGNAMVSQLEASIASMDVNRSKFVDLMRDSAAKYAEGMRRLAEGEAVREAALKRR